MKLSTAIQGVWGKKQVVVNGQHRVVALNAFSFDSKYKGDYAEWDLSNPSQPVLNLRVTKDGDNTAFARMFSCTSITMFGRYETIGAIAPIDGEKIPVLPGTRGQGGMSSMMYDMEWVAKKAGYPCKATEVPPTVAHIDCIIPDDMYANKLIDLYFNYMTDGVDMNSHISPNQSRHLNAQIQCGIGKPINPAAHAQGGSGGTRLMIFPVIDNVEWDLAYKHETHNGNSFPFISFAPRSGEPVAHVRTDLITNWLLDNWSTVERACAEYGCDLFDVTIETLRASYIDSPHVGNEVLGRAVGSIKYRRLEIEVTQNKPDNNKNDDRTDQTPVVDTPHDSPSPIKTTPPPSEVAPVKEDAKPKKKKCGWLSKLKNKVWRNRTRRLTVSLSSGKELKIPNSAGGRVIGYSRDDILSNTDTYKALEFKPLRAGSVWVKWRDRDGREFKTKVRVIE